MPVRRVRTIAGSKTFGQPIGTIITRDMIRQAKLKGKLGFDRLQGGTAANAAMNQGIKANPSHFQGGQRMVPQNGEDKTYAEDMIALIQELASKGRLKPEDQKRLLAVARNRLRRAQGQRAKNRDQASGVIDDLKDAGAKTGLSDLRPYVSAWKKQHMMGTKTADHMKQKIEDAKTAVEQKRNPQRKTLGAFSQELFNRVNRAKIEQGKTSPVESLRDKWMIDPKGSPAGKILDNGGTLEDCVTKGEVDGMLQYVHTHPQRFKITVTGQSSVTNTYSIEDLDNGGKRYFIKDSINDGDAKMYGDGINEILTQRLGNVAFPGMFPTVHFAESPSHGGNPPLLIEHAEEFAKAKGWTVKAYDIADRHGNTIEDMLGFKTTGKKMGDGIDPGEVLALHIFDYLTNQKDRHGCNLIDAEDGNGRTHLIPIDQGASFMAYMPFLTEMNDALKTKGSQLGYTDEWLSNPDSIGYTDWADVSVLGVGTHYSPDQTEWARGLGGMSAWNFQARNRLVAFEARKAFEAQLAGKPRGQVRAAVKKQAEAILSRMRAVDIDRVAAEIHQEYPTMDSYESDHLTASLAIWKNRLTLIDADDIADTIVETDLFPEKINPQAYVKGEAQFQNAIGFIQNARAAGIAQLPTAKVPEEAAKLVYQARKLQQQQQP